MEGCIEGRVKLPRRGYLWPSTRHPRPGNDAGTMKRQPENVSSVSDGGALVAYEHDGENQATFGVKLCRCSVHVEVRQSARGRLSNDTTLHNHHSTLR